MLRYAERTREVGPSAVREILKIAERPDVLSFAGGLPAPELFPLDALKEAHAAVFREQAGAALQYSTTEGFGPLREWIATRFSSQGASTQSGDLLVTNGSQQGIDLAARVLLDPFALVVTENPTYVAALQVFQASQARVRAVESDAEGMRLESLAQVLASNDVRLIYVVPNFANPTGVTWSARRRAGLVALAQAWRVPILEDDPYGAIRFRGQPLPPLCALEDDGLVLSLGTFSKTLAPGLRLGWLRARGEALKYLVVAKQASDLHASTLSQRAVARLLSTWDYDGHLETLRTSYRSRCEAMTSAIAQHFPDGSRFVHPEGGLFVWVTLPPHFDTQDLLAQCVAQERIAYVPGSPFFAHQPRPNTMRLNYSNRSVADIMDGMRRLGAFFRRVECGSSTPSGARHDAAAAR